MSVDLDDALRQLGDALRRVTVQVRTRGRAGDTAGSGVLWREDGLVVTNAHVARERNALVELHDGRTVAAHRVAVDAARDIAALRLEIGDLPAARHGGAATLRPGNVVVALGNPLGWVGALSLGVVHGVDRFRGAPRWIRADVRLAPGNSGGPLADATGAVVGINAMIVGGLGVALPSEAVERFLVRPDLRPSLGLALRPALARGRRGGAAALVVTGVRPRSPAARAGLRPGDALLGIGGDPFGTAIDLAVALEATHVGDVLSFDLLREGRLARRELRLDLERGAEVGAA